MTESARLFTLRLWPAAETGDGDSPQWHGDRSQWHGDRSQWRGKIQSLPDGEAYNFADWLDLIRALEVMLATRPDKTQEE